MRYARLLCALFVCGCVGTESSTAKSTGGTLAISTGGDPDVLIPSLLQTVQAGQISDMIYDRLADIGDSLTYSTTADSRRDSPIAGPGALIRCVLRFTSIRQRGGTTAYPFARTTFASPLPAPGIPRSDHPYAVDLEHRFRQHP